MYWSETRYIALHGDAMALIYILRNSLMQHLSVQVIQKTENFNQRN